MQLLLGQNRVVFNIQKFFNSEDGKMPPFSGAQEMSKNNQPSLLLHDGMPPLIDQAVTGSCWTLDAGSLLSRSTRTFEQTEP